VLVKVANGFFTDIGNIPRDLFWAELGVTRFNLVIFNVLGGIAIFLNQPF